MKPKSKPQPKKHFSGMTILAMLEERDDWYSGEELAERLGVSRAAVAKHVAALRRDGHAIASGTNRGYRLLVRHERIDFALVEPHLKTRVLGRKGWRSLADTTSTNTEAITWALSGGGEGAVVTAERQSQGKGRKGRDWFSSPRGLHFSIILRPRSHVVDDGAIIHAALHAMRESAAALTGLRAEIKEPNDLYLDGRKIGGVLIESGSRAGEPDWMAVGIGCNVNVLPEEFPDAIRGRVTSLYEASGKGVSRNHLLALILTRLEKRLRLFCS